MKNKLIIFILVVIISAVVLVLKEVNISRSRKVEIPKPEYNIAPDFSLHDIYGDEKKLSDFKGKVVILDFWATWCPPCKAEIPHFIELYDEYSDKGLEIIGVALDWNAKRVVAPFSEQHGINYTILLGNNYIADLYGGIISIPTTFIIDRDGKIRKRYIGYREKEVFENEIKKLL